MEIDEEIRIGVDLDDTIISQYDEVLKILNERYDLDIDYNKVSYWNWTQDTYDEVTRDEILDIVYNFKPYDCKPVDKYVTKYFNKLSKKYYVEIVTARWGPEWLEMDIWRALSQMGLKDFHGINLCGRTYKQDLGFHVLVDDNPNLAMNLMETDGPVLVLYDRPWNWNVECENHWNLFRARDWKQVYKIIKSL